MLTAVLSGFILAAIAPWVHRLFKGAAGWLLAILPAALTVYFAGFLGQIENGEAVRHTIDWVPFLGVELSFWLDGLSLMFALLICGIGTFIIIYAGGYLKGHVHQGRFYSFMLMFMASMLGLVLADNIITLFVFWELTSITSFLLIGFDHSRKAARRAALQALVVTGGGGLILLAGLILMALVGVEAGLTQPFELSTLLANGDLLRDHPWYMAILVLVLFGAFTKSAQVPFHFWLPNAMEAPTPVSAYLHSATMVKAGVYLLARLNPGLGGTEEWTAILVLFGAATFLFGTVMAVRRVDLKLILANTTVASLGLLVMLIGIGTEKALQAAMLYLLAHSLFKGALFMIAGCVDHETGTRESIRLGGLGRKMPVTATAAALAGLSMAGLPPFFGFIAKEFIYEATLTGPWFMTVTAVTVIASALMFAVAGMVAARPFYGTLTETPKKPHEGPPSLWLGPIVLAALALAFGIAHHLPESLFIAPAASAVAGQPIAVKLFLWHGVNTALILSGLTVALGLVLYLLRNPLRHGFAAVIDRLWGPDRGYDQFMAGLVAFSRVLTNRVQDGRLRHYMLITFVVAIAAVALPVLRFNLIPTSFDVPETDFYIYGVSFLAIVGALALIFARSRIQAILSMGVLGFSVALIFLLFGAPDLAFTQFMVETLSVVIIALILMRLPLDGYDKRRPGVVLRDAVVALGVGGAFTVTLLAVTAGELDLTLSEFFAEASYTQAFGRNIVNVILVDFRALDTLGEIAVVMVAAVSALALIMFRTRKARIIGSGESRS